MVYKCNKCGKVFSLPISKQEKVGEFWGAPAYETYYRCPYCESESFNEVEEGTIYKLLITNNDDVESERYCICYSKKDLFAMIGAIYSCWNNITRVTYAEYDIATEGYPESVMFVTDDGTIGYPISTGVCLSSLK